MFRNALQGRRFAKTLLTAAIAGALAMPTASFAQKGGDSTDYRPVTSYRVEANSEFWVNLNLCSPTVVVDVRGDGDTDVDFTIYDQNNNQVYQDLDLDDITTATLNPRVRNGNCVVYRMKLNNLGNVWNQVTVTVGENTANGDAPSIGSYRVEANDDYWVDLTLCHRRARIVAAGDGDTDVDYVVYDQRDNVLASDYATHDRMDATINTGSYDGTCRPFRLKLNNLGNVWNQVTVTIYDLD